MKNSSVFIKILWGLLICLSLGTIIHGLIRIEMIATGSPPDLSTNDLGYVNHPYLTYLHIIPGILFMICGPFQFIGKIRKTHINIHRFTGRVFIICGLVTGIMAIPISILFPQGGATETSATLTFSLILLFSILKAFYHIKRKEVLIHREWMIRTYMIGMGVGTVRLWIPLLAIFTNLKFEDLFGIAFWLAFTMHLIFAEVWINVSRKKKIFIR